MKTCRRGTHKRLCSSDRGQNCCAVRNILLANNYFEMFGLHPREISDKSYIRMRFHRFCCCIPVDIMPSNSAPDQVLEAATVAAFVTALIPRLTSYSLWDRLYISRTVLTYNIFWSWAHNLTMYQRCTANSWSEQYELQELYEAREAELTALRTYYRNQQSSTAFGQPFRQSNVVQPMGQSMGLPNPWVEAARREEQAQVNTMPAQVPVLPGYTPSGVERRVDPLPMRHQFRSHHVILPQIIRSTPNGTSYLGIVARRLEFYWS
eukprot:6484908-Amphidinium_carterae.2